MKYYKINKIHKNNWLKYDKYINKNILTLNYLKIGQNQFMQSQKYFWIYTFTYYHRNIKSTYSIYFAQEDVIRD